MVENKIRILMIGSLPPPIGGTTVLFKQLVDELTECPDLSVSVLNTAVSGTKGILGRLKVLLNLMRAIINEISVCDAISFHASVSAGFLFTPILIFLSSLYRKPVIFRGFGGDYKEKYIDASFLRKALFRLGVLRCNSILLETKDSVEFFKLLTKSSVFWYPNSRPLVLSDTLKVSDNDSSRKKTPKFIFVGHVKPSKGVLVLRDALSLVNGTVCVDVYGPLLDGLTESELHAPGLRYCGVLLPEEVLRVMANYDCVVLPTFYEGEGYPGVILEGYSLALPVITTNWRAIPEIVSEDTGILVKPGDATSLALALQTIFDSPELLARFKEGARNAAFRFSSVEWTHFFVRTVKDCLK